MMKNGKATTRIAVASMLVLAGSLISISSLCAAGFDFIWTQATVIGTASDLQKFDQTIRGLAHREFNKDYIGCKVGCEALTAVTSPPASLVYVFERNNKKIFSKFVEAWNQVLSSNQNPDFRVVFDGDVTTPDCAPASCKPNPMCSDSCGRPCSAC